MSINSKGAGTIEWQTCNGELLNFENQRKGRENCNFAWERENHTV